MIHSLARIDVNHAGFARSRDEREVDEEAVAHRRNGIEAVAQRALKVAVRVSWMVHESYVAAGLPMGITKSTA